MNVRHFELVREANKFLMENYNTELMIPIEFNTRLKRVFGRMCYKKKNGQYIPEKIEMSVDFMQTHPKEHIIDILKHELVHYVLCEKQLPFNDGDKVFEDELKRLGVSRTHTYHYLGDVHHYECKNCGKTYERKRKLVKTAYCMCSVGPNLEYKGIVTKELELELGKMKEMTAFSAKGFTTL